MVVGAIGVRGFSHCVGTKLHTLSDGVGALEWSRRLFPSGTKLSTIESSLTLVLKTWAVPVTT